MIQPEVLRTHYQQFLNHPRILLTGHSHQAWPDIAKTGMNRAFDHAALHVDDKWSYAMDTAHALCKLIAKRMGGRAEDIALAGSTHDLVVRFLSALTLKTKRKIIVTTGEFHTLHRQLRRLSEEGIEVTWVDTHPIASLTERMADAVDGNTAAVF